MTDLGLKETNMKTLKMIGAALFAAFLALNFVACKDDDEMELNAYEQRIVGHYTLYTNDLIVAQIEFRSDKTGIRWNELNGVGTITEQKNFTWSANETNIIFEGVYDNNTATYTLTSEKLLLVWPGGTFTTLWVD